MAVFKHLHLTKLQWQGVLRWGLYSLALLVTLVLETVLFGKLRVLGAKLTIVPLLLCCAAIREGPEKGGLFALIGSVLWCFSGTDMGNLSVAAVTVMAVLSAVLCKAVLTDSLVSSALCCLVTLMVNGGVIFAFKLLLTGTPVENRLSEYWSVMDFANPGLLGTAKDFQKEFASPIEDGHDIEAARRLRRVTAPFIMRRLKSDKKIISDLPDKISKDEYCTLSPAQAALYKAQLDASFDAMRQIGADPGKRTAAIITMITRLKKICNAPEQFAPSDSHKGPEFSGKAMQLMEILDALHKSGRKALVFTQFKEMGALLQKWIGERTGRTPLFINGSVAPSKRAEIVDKFQRDRRERVLVLTLKAAGTGLNLTAASAVIHYDLWWNPAVESQATDRAYRIGQTRNVQVWRLICAHTFEEKINEMIESKKELADMAVNVGEKWIGDMSNRQLEEIFSLSGDGAEDAQAQA